MAFEVAPRRRDQLACAVAIAGRMKRKQALASEVRSKPPFLILTGAEDRLLTADEITEKLGPGDTQVLKILLKRLIHDTDPGLPDLWAPTVQTLSAQA